MLSDRFAFLKRHLPAVQGKFALTVIALLFLLIVVASWYFREPFTPRPYDPSEFITQLSVNIKPTSQGSLNVQEEIKVSLTGKKERHGIRRSFPKSIESLAEKGRSLQFQILPKSAAVLSAQGSQQIDLKVEDLPSGYLSLPLRVSDKPLQPGLYNFPIAFEVQGAIFNFQTITVLEWPLMDKLGTPARELRATIILPTDVSLNDTQARLISRIGDTEEALALRTKNTEVRGKSFSILKSRTSNPDEFALKVHSHRSIDPQESIYLQVAWPRGYVDLK